VTNTLAYPAGEPQMGGRGAQADTNWWTPGELGRPRPACCQRSLPAGNTSSDFTPKH